MALNSLNTLILQVALFDLFSAVFCCNQAIFVTENEVFEVNRPVKFSNLSGAFCLNKAIV